MRHLYYALQAIIRGKESNVIKIISLTLGGFIGILLLARVAFDLSYDNCYPDIDRLFYLQRQSGEKGGGWGEPSLYNYGSMAAALKENFPEVESATMMSIPEERTYIYEDRKADKMMSMFCDEQFFSTTGIPLLEGDEAALKDVDVAFVSRSFARWISGDLSVVGKTVMLKKFDNGYYPFTIRGIYEDIPENSELHYDVIYTLPTFCKMLGVNRAGWGYDISYHTLVRFRQEANVENVQARIGDMLKKYIPQEGGEHKELHTFKAVRGYHADRSEVHRMVSILSILGFSILLIAAMNYVLISISSLHKRSKAVGVHKCSGASGKDIFMMFLCETGMLILVALLIITLLMLNFKDEVEYIAEASLSSLFSWEVMWVPGLVILSVFLVVACLPGSFFASIPVTQVFRRYSESRGLWKRFLLFIQFLGMPFIMGLMIVVLVQYHYIVNRDLGYNPRGIVSVFNQFPDADALFRNLPMIEGYANGSSIISGYSGGENITLGNGKNLSVCLGWSDARFVPLMGIHILEGRNFSREGEALVNEEFVRQMNQGNSPIGQNLSYFLGEATITGVMKDYPVRSAYFPQDPVVLVALPGWGPWTLRLKPPYDENLRTLNKTMKEMFPTKDVVFTSLQKGLDMQYDSVHRFRDVVILAFVSIFLIGLIGLVGYVNDEMRQRSKEIAIRKVNGADAFSIFWLLSRNIMLTAFPAVLLGTSASWYIGQKWLEQFVEQMPFSLWVYAGIAVGVLFVIVVSVMIRTWYIINENPVNSIKSE